MHMESTLEVYSIYDGFKSFLRPYNQAQCGPVCKYHNHVEEGLHGKHL